MILTPFRPRQHSNSCASPPPLPPTQVKKSKGFGNEPGHGAPRRKGGGGGGGGVILPTQAGSFSMTIPEVT